jgi:hypothetical protein
MTWIPLTKSCQANAKDGSPCRGWWAVWNQPDRCPECGSATSLSSRRGATEWDQFCWQVPSGAIGARVPFSLGASDDRQYKLMPGIRGVAEFVRGSVQLRPESPLDRRSLDELAGKVGSGRELSRWFGKGQADSDVRGFAYLVLDGRFGLRVQVVQAFTSDLMEAEAIVELDVAVASDLQRFVSRFLARLGQAGSGAVQSRWPSDSDVAAELPLGELERAVSESCRSALATAIKRQPGRRLLDVPGSMLDSATEQQLRGLLDDLGLQLFGQRSALVRIPVLEREREQAARRKGAEVERGSRLEALAGRAEEANLREAEVRAEVSQRRVVEQAAEETEALFAQRALELTIRTRLERNQTVVGAREAAEEVNERLRRLQSVVRERLQADQLSVLKSERAFQDVVRKAEHEASLEGLMRADEIEALRRKLEAGATLDQAAIDLKLRALTRGAEVDEATHAIALQRLQDEYHEQAEERRIKIDRMRSSAASDAEIEQERRRMALAHEHMNFLAEVSERKKEARSRRQQERDRLAMEFEQRKLELLANQRPEVAAILRDGVNPEVVRAVFAAQSGREADERVRALEKELQDRTKAVMDSKGGEVERVSALVSQMVEALGAVARQQATQPRASINVDTGGSVRRPRAEGE